MKKLTAPLLLSAAITAAMDQGAIVEEGSPEQIFGSPQHARTRDFLSKVP